MAPKFCTQYQIPCLHNRKHAPLLREKPLIPLLPRENWAALRRAGTCLLGCSVLPPKVCVHMSVHLSLSPGSTAKKAKSWIISYPLHNNGNWAAAWLAHLLCWLMRQSTIQKNVCFSKFSPFSTTMHIANVHDPALFTLPDQEQNESKYLPISVQKL